MLPSLNSSSLLREMSAKCEKRAQGNVCRPRPIDRRWKKPRHGRRIRKSGCRPRPRPPSLPVTSRLIRGEPGPIRPPPLDDLSSVNRGGQEDELERGGGEPGPGGPRQHPLLASSPPACAAFFRRQFVPFLNVGGGGGGGTCLQAPFARCLGTAPYEICGNPSGTTFSKLRFE